MTVEEIRKIIKEDSDYEYYGVRGDAHGYKTGERHAKSHNWFQDEEHILHEEHRGGACMKYYVRYFSNKVCRIACFENDEGQAKHFAKLVNGTVFVDW